MHVSQVWVICGDNQGIGPAAVEYLLSRGQYVVPIATAESAMQESKHINRPGAAAEVQNIIAQYGGIDKLIIIGEPDIFASCAIEVMQKNGHGHLIQFSDVQDSSDSGSSPVHINLPGALKDAGVLYTLLKPDCFFQSFLYSPTTSSSNFS